MDKNLTGVIFFSILLSSCSLSTTQEMELRESGARQLTQSEIINSYIGNTLSGKTPDGSAFHVYIPDNKQFFMYYEGEKSHGQWRISDDPSFCYVMDGDTVEYCTREYMQDERIKSVNPDGTIAGTAQIRPGNPEDL
jgi:hypothetical protein